MDTNSASWRKSSYSGNNGGACIEAADHDGRVLVRDSTDRQGPVLRFGSAAWRIFTARLKTSS